MECESIKREAQGQRRALHLWAAPLDSACKSLVFDDKLMKDNLGNCGVWSWSGSIQLRGKCTAESDFLALSSVSRKERASSCLAPEPHIIRIELIILRKMKAADIPRVRNSLIANMFNKSSSFSVPGYMRKAPFLRKLEITLDRCYPSDFRIISATYKRPDFLKKIAHAIPRGRSACLS